jgi:hypothetical protein
VLGKVSSQQPAPASFTDPLYVVLPDFSPDHSEPARWAPLWGLALPEQGVDVLVALDDSRRPYAVWWDGSLPVAPTVTGSRGGNAALASLLTQLASAGLIVNSTTA